MRYFFVFFFSFWAMLGRAQEVSVRPYIQNAEPNSVYIMWETNDGEESVVEWGLSDQLGESTAGSMQTTQGGGNLHTVQLQGLERFTRYYYRVRTGSFVSDVYYFKTPPFASDNESFRFAAMSDMQRDGNNPTKWEEIVNDGVIAYLEDNFGSEISDELALLMIPGDLVDNGLNYNEWQNEFFGPASTLLSYVPVYPVPGNHELNTTFFFQYFNLPDNGTPGFEEHWWFKDYGNIRIIGLDSNFPFTNQAQLDWLETTLNQTCQDEDIDFVFAQLHHPYHSELWTPGNLDYTGDVISLLEDFSTDCGKPSVHFFGHTHAYSRGQSRDHKHVMVNVATGGGAIDNWGEFPQFDYDEFSVSYDEFGFVMVEVIPGDDPHFILKRLSFGDDDVILDNVLRDSLVIRMNETAVQIPNPVFPVNTEVIPDCIELKADAFDMLNVSGHGQAHWQLVNFNGSFDDPAFESWKNYENIYYEVDTQADDDLTDELVFNLSPNSIYKWRVRYRDRELNWSDWSEDAIFTTGDAIQSLNLLNNSGAEENTTYWQAVEGNIEALTAGECNGIDPYAGFRYFAVGGVCDDAAFGRAHQDIDVIEWSEEIDAGGYGASWGGYLSNWGGSDVPAIQLIFLDESEVEIGSTEVISNINSNWTFYSQWNEAPEGTRTIRFELTGTRNSGADNDSYFDELFLRVGGEFDDCAQFTSSVIERQKLSNFRVYPNPATDLAILDFGKVITDPVVLAHDQRGQLVELKVEMKEQQVILDCSGLSSGIYMLQVFSGAELLGGSRLVVQKK